MTCVARVLLRDGESGTHGTTRTDARSDGYVVPSSTSGLPSIVGYLWLL